MAQRFRQQALIDAPVSVVWDLLGDPERHAEWWPTVLEVECGEIEEGCRFRQVVKPPLARAVEHEFALERLDDCREVRIRCVGTGWYTQFVLTEAQHGTFVDAEFGAEPEAGADPEPLAVRTIMSVAGRRYLRHWMEQSLDALKAAASREP
jgi:uncharacterized protein YndB with AHSA1/START domain